MYRLQVKTHFDAAHYLADYFGKCSRLHGHRWEVEVCLQGPELDNLNMLIDFGDIKNVLNGILERRLDHYNINETLSEPNPTAEFLAKWVYDAFVEDLGVIPFPCEVVRVCIWESPDCCVKYSPDMRSINEAH